MADLTPQGMATKLLAAGFERNGPSAAALTDPIADTPMIVTLDQLRPYDHDPRVKRNPAYEEIKASIRERGLDAAPAITRRPGDEHYIIRNGGNTRLAILRELWSETKDERFFRISCLFRPWPERGEVVMLTGHLAENEVRGGLTFIERALGTEKARAFYEQESGQPLSQSELARRLTADGYPVQQSHISRMQDAVRYLLPAIPTVLYGGLGRHQVEKLAVMRKACERVWERYAVGRTELDFDAFFGDVLAHFDITPEGFSAQRVQDELIGQMAELLQVNYDTLALDLNESENRHRALTSEPTSSAPVAPEPVTLPPAAPRQLPKTPGTAPTPVATDSEQPPSAPTSTRDENDNQEATATAAENTRLQQHIVSDAPTTERLQAIQSMVASQLGDTLPDFESTVLQAIPVQAGGLYPISDVWYIEPGLDVPERLRVHIAQFAREIAEEANVADHIEASDSSIGFICVSLAVEQAQALPAFARTVLTLLHALSTAPASTAGLDNMQLAGELGPLLHGHGSSATRLSDTGLVKLFRLLRLARRLLDLKAGSTDRGS